MKSWIPFCALCALFFGCLQNPPVRGTASEPPVYKKSDLQKLQWIVGNWRSDVEGAGFYQTYHFPNDSVLEVISYLFDGKDSSGTTVSQLFWKDDHLYLGANGEWVAVWLDKTSIQLDPVRPDWITIAWTQNAPDEWVSVQEKTNFKRTVKMQRKPLLNELMGRKKE